MKPIFTIHAGEYLAGSEIERQCPDWEIWIPSRDTGIDLLMRHKRTGKTKTIQVKFSKSFTEDFYSPEIGQYFNTQGWWALKKQKIEISKAEYWVFVLYSFHTTKNDFLIFTKKELISLFKKLGKWDKEIIQTYFWTLKNGTAFEGRGLKKRERTELIENPKKFKNREITKHLNGWELLNK